MIKENLVTFLVENESESSYLDFKSSNPYIQNKESFLKDIMAMANSKHQGNKYIIMGVKERPNGSKEVIGLSDQELVDSSFYYQLVLNNIEPEINFRYYTLEYGCATICVFELYENNERPYLMKKDFGKLKSGYCLIRKGSQQSVAVRSDYEEFFSSSGKVDISILDPHLAAVYEEYGGAGIEVSIRNLTELPVTLIGGKLLVKGGDHNIITSHPVMGLDEDIEDFKLYLPPRSEKIGDIIVVFTSNQSLQLGLNEYGTSDLWYNFELIFWDTKRNEYTTSVERGIIYAKGEFLWKIKLHAKEGRSTETKNRKKRFIDKLMKK